jgi:hypothetical protein
MAAPSLARTSRTSSFENALEEGQGVLRLAPNWVPRSFCVPGRRIKLHPLDYFALGGARGGIDERWLSSTVRADNGPLTGPDEGLTLAAGGQALVRDAAAYGCIAVQGRGTFGPWSVETPTLVRFGELTADEYFVSEDAARAGVLVKNLSETEPLVILKHFGPENPETPVLTTEE